MARIVDGCGPACMEHGPARAALPSLVLVTRVSPTRSARLRPGRVDTRFSGVARVDLADGTVVDRADGMADRRWGVPFGTDTRSGIAERDEGLHGASTAMALIVAGSLSLDTTARSVLGTTCR